MACCRADNSVSIQKHLPSAAIADSLANGYNIRKDIIKCYNKRKDIIKCYNIRKDIIKYYHKRKDIIKILQD